MGRARIVAEDGRDSGESAMNTLEVDQFWSDLKKFEMCMLVTYEAH